MMASPAESIKGSSSPFDIAATFSRGLLSVRLAASRESGGRGCSVCQISVVVRIVFAVLRRLIAGGDQNTLLSLNVDDKTQ